MELITNRLILRDFQEGDWRAVLEYQSDPLYLRYYEWTERTPAAVQDFVQMFIDHQGQTPRTRFQLAVTLKDNGKLIGNCGIRMSEPAAFEAEIGYELAPEEWGNGYASEAGQGIIKFGFETLKVHRISAWCVADNLASVRVLEKLGLRQEGRLREKAYYKGRWWNELVFAILEDEWRARQDGGQHGG